MALNRGGGETRADSRAVCQNGTVAYELFMSTKAIYFGFAEQENVLCCLWSQTTDIFSQVGLQQHNRITHKGTEFDDNSSALYFKLPMYFTMNACFNIGY
jgi:hypothetical protein